MLSERDLTGRDSAPLDLPAMDPAAGAVAEESAEAIRAAFAAYQSRFQEITRQARRRFAQCDWHSLQADAARRLDLYNEHVRRTVAALAASLEVYQRDKPFWTAVKACYSAVNAAREDRELAETFFNSVSMRLVAPRAIDPEIEYVDLEPLMLPPPLEKEIYRVHPAGEPTTALVADLLAAYDLGIAYEDRDRDARLVAAAIDARLHDLGQDGRMQLIEMARPIFYRGKGAYLVGRIATRNHYVPLVLVLLHGPGGVYVDAVLLTEDDVSIVFSFTRAYFHVDTEYPAALVGFLKLIVPRKHVAEIYISIGYNKHGKTELYRDLLRHLAGSTDRFEIAPGARGMVMTVFTLTSYDVVFKIIKDQFDYPKTTTRREVQSRYQLVFKHDRGGRLVDAQEFEHLRFAKSRFAPDLLAELLNVAANTVSVDGEEVVIKHLYTERRLTPLDLYLRQVDPADATAVVMDYGQAIRDLAATNIFPGDLLLKNFGVTRHRRVVFYDYDELCLLTDCRFREMPPPADPDEDMAAEPWFSVDENDVFPEELVTFLGLPPPLRAIFAPAHGDLFGVPFWAQLQARLAAGEVIDILPYKPSHRLQPAAGGQG